MGKPDSLKLRREEAKQIVSEMKSKSEQVESFVQKATDMLKEINSSKKTYNKLIPNLSDIQKRAVDLISEFQEKRNVIRKQLTTIDNYYQKKYLPLYTELVDRGTGLSATGAFFS